MARKTRKSSRSGSTLYGLLAGLIIGLAAAVAVAMFVTNAPMPFADKFSRAPAETLLPDVRDAPDPNIALYGKSSPAGTSPNGLTDTSVAPLPGAASTSGTPSLSDSIGELIASLGKDDKAAPAGKASAAPAAQPPVAVPGTGVSPSQPKPPATPAKPSPATQTTYFLQAGAFRSENDAEAVKARIIMLGIPAQVQKAQINGATINRVRVGPFKGIDEMNRSRARLGEEKIVSSVVRP